MRLKSVKVLILSFIVLGMLNIPLVQAGKPHDVRAGEYGHRIAVWNEDSWEFSEDDPTYLLYGWVYLEEEWEDYPMPVKMEVHCEDIEFKVFRFSVKTDVVEHITPIFYFYVLFEPYTFSVGIHYLETYLTFHGERLDIGFDISHNITVLPVNNINM